MSDMSHLDKKYFIDNYVYNCPYCNIQLDNNGLNKLKTSPRRDLNPRHFHYE